MKKVNVRLHESAKRIVLLNEHSQEMELRYWLEKDAGDGDSYPLVSIGISARWIAIAKSDHWPEFFLATRDDVNEVIRKLEDLRDKAFPHNPS